MNLPLRVFYGFAKLNNTVKKAELVVVFENGSNNPERNDTFINKAMIVVYKRFQTEGEVIDASASNRMFTKYGQFIDERPWKGDFEKLLQMNFEADSNNVSLEERNLIREKLREEYYRYFKRKPLQQLQLEL
jgi:hypothetical protein